MKYVGIIAAEDKEISAVKNMMTDVVQNQIFNVVIYIGKINGVNCILAKSGVGKVNASRTAQIIIDRFEVSALINTGSAGALDKKLKIGDIVISTGLVQYDFDVTAFGRELGFIPETGKIFEADKKLVFACEESLTKIGVNYYKGLIATADKFLSNSELKNNVKNEFNALCCEMEGAAVAQVCRLSNVPFVVIRSISDELIGDAKVDFDEFLETASKRCAELILDVIDKF